MGPVFKEFFKKATHLSSTFPFALICEYPPRLKHNHVLLVIQWPSIEYHVNELWLFPIFLDCDGYQQWFCSKLKSIDIFYMYLDFIKVSRSNIKQ